MDQPAEIGLIGGVGTEGGPFLPAAFSAHVLTTSGTVAQLHEPISFTEPLVRIARATDTAMVLGRAQQPALLNHHYLEEHNIGVVQRASGGGAVYVTPNNITWIDVIIPRDHELWTDDVNEAFYWIGDWWASALIKQGLSAQVHKGAFVCNDVCKLVCFAGLGPGEVTVDGKKLVGISQRRTREGARFQCALLLEWQPEIYMDALPLEESARGLLNEVAAPLTYCSSKTVLETLLAT